MTEAERRLQEEVREFLAEHVPRHLPHALDERIEALRRWQGRCYAGRIRGPRVAA